MSHFYSQQKNGKVRLLKSIDTIAKARKHGNCVKSVTTVLSLFPRQLRGFDINNWRERRLVQLAREYPHEPEEKLLERLWGYREDLDGSTLTSSEFGTKLHAEMEEAVNQRIAGADYHSPYSHFYEPFMRWLDDAGVVPQLVEFSVMDNKRRVAGMIDFVGQRGKKRVLMDFKFRQGDPRRKSYETDLCQLAVEADIIANEWGYDIEDVECYSVIFDCVDAQMLVKKWPIHKVEWGIEAFDKLNESYNFFTGL